MTDRLERLEAHITKSVAGFLTELRSTKKPPTGTDAMTIPTEAAAAIAELRSNACLISASQILRIATRIESALTAQASAVAWRYKTSSGRWAYSDGPRDPREFHDNGKVHEPLYAHAPPAVPVESLSDESGLHQRSEAWLKVAATLDRVSPSWRKRGGKGMSNAIDEIEALAAPPPASVPDGWMPIETAPKDGTPIIGLGPVPRYGDIEAHETKWELYGEGSQAKAMFDRGEGPSGEWGWHEPIHRWGSSWEPTHWIPRPPTNQEGAAP